MLRERASNCSCRLEGETYSFLCYGLNGAISSTDIELSKRLVSALSGQCPHDGLSAIVDYRMPTRNETVHHDE
jgi:hypothetical protein